MNEAMTWDDAIRRHYQSAWNIAGSSCPLPAGPIHDLPIGFSILRYEPHGNRSMWTYATCCMSQPADRSPIELHIFSPLASDLIVELLVATAHYHRTGHALDLWHTVNFGRPWLGGSACEHGFISLPYLDGPQLEDLRSGTSSAKCYWLIPVTNAEVRFKAEHGVKALEASFEEASFNYLDPKRPSAV
jgi:hypothetical protein